MQDTVLTTVAAVTALAYLANRARHRLTLSRAKHRSLAGHVRISKLLAARIPGYAYDAERFFDSDGASAPVVALRKAGFDALCSDFAARFPMSAQMTARARESMSDLQFTAAYRVPFQYSPYLRSRLSVGGFVRASEGTMVEDLDGNRFHDLTGWARYWARCIHAWWAMSNGCGSCPGWTR
jgi:glutamate-1-semialdehyde 2,1-aminomutase